MALNKQQQIAVKAYCAGEFAYITSPEVAAYSGDGLFKFIVAELSTLEGCENVPDAINRMHRAVDDLQVVLDALTKRGQ